MPTFLSFAGTKKTVRILDYDHINRLILIETVLTGPKVCMWIQDNQTHAQLEDDREKAMARLADKASTYDQARVQQKLKEHVLPSEIFEEIPIYRTVTLGDFSKTTYFHADLE